MPVQARLSLSAEGARDPRVLVVKVPDGDTHAPGHGKTGAHDSTIIIGLLGVAGSIGGKTRESDVELSVSDIDVECDEGVEDVGQIGLAGRSTDDEVALEANTVDRCASSLYGFDDVECRGGFRPGVLDVVVVVVQAGVWIRGSCGFEGDGKV